MKRRTSTANPDSLRIVCISDTHRLHREVQVSVGDLLIHAGDICHQGECVQTLVDFNDWLGELPHPVKICVPGNHDVPLEHDPATRKLLTNATLLINDGMEFRGLRVWGSPVTPLSGGAFGMWYPPDRRRIFSLIPDDTDILVTHVPPLGTLDSTPEGSYHAGDPELLAAIQCRDIPLHVFGHHHRGYGIEWGEERVSVNAALLGEDGGIDREPIVLKIPRR